MLVRRYKQELQTIERLWLERCLQLFSQRNWGHDASVSCPIFFRICSTVVKSPSFIGGLAHVWVGQHIGQRLGNAKGKGKGRGFGF